jgi:acetate kinase
MTPAMHTVLALNLGSTSLKGARYVRVAVTDDWTRKERVTVEFDTGPRQVSDHGLQALAEQLSEDSTPDVVVHRIVHGGDRERAAELDRDTLAELETLSPLAPLHQPQALDLVRRARERWPTARQWAAFDTTWHATMPLQHRVLPLPKDLFDQGVKRYGFHGLAFQSAMRQLRVLAPGRAGGRVVLAHLGGGSSVCAVRGSRSVNTTMGMTPLGGIPMASRPGSLDPGVVLYLQRALGLPPDAIDRLLWRESGLKGLSGESGDMRALLASRSDDAMLAIDVYVGAVAQAIAAMAACIGGIDALVFSGGIGAHAIEIRQRIVDDLAWLGLRTSGASPDAMGEPLPQAFAMDVDEETELVMQWRQAQASDTTRFWP